MLNTRGTFFNTQTSMLGPNDFANHSAAWTRDKKLLRVLDFFFVSEILFSLMHIFRSFQNINISQKGLIFLLVNLQFLNYFVV